MSSSIFSRIEAIQKFTCGYKFIFSLLNIVDFNVSFFNSDIEDASSLCTLYSDEILAFWNRMMLNCISVSSISPSLDSSKTLLISSILLANLNSDVC